MSWRLAPSTLTPMGIPFPSVNRLRLVPFWPRSVGFGPVPLPPRAEPLSWLHPLPATANLSLAPGRIQTNPAPTTPRRPRRLANAGTCHGQCSEHRTSEATPSTGSRSAARRRSHPYTGGQVSTASRPSDPPSRQAITAQSSPTEHRESANQRLRLHDRSPTRLSSTQVGWRKFMQSLGYSPRTIKFIG